MVMYKLTFDFLEALTATGLEHNIVTVANTGES